MSVQTDIEAIKTALIAVEDQHRRTGAALRKVHELLRSGLLQHAELLGLDETEAGTMAGTPKEH
jgi:ribosomal 50S subunit-associated protein YjgA (DUF615 family)